MLHSIIFPVLFIFITCKHSLAVTVVIVDVGDRYCGGAIQAGELAATPVARHLARSNAPDLSAINGLVGEGEGERKKNQKSRFSKAK